MNSPVRTERPFEDDVIQPFQIEASNLRGRLIRVGSMLDEILTRHAYPEPVARLLAETIVVAVALAAALKYDGIFTLQTKGDGPIRLMVADVTSTGDVRGYAQYGADRLATVPADAAPVPELLGSGYLAFTVDQGENTDRYQGIVELSGDTLSDCVQHYFRQSEQLITGFKIAADKRDAGWCGGAIMLQRMPEQQTGLMPGSHVEDDWRRAMVLLGTCTAEELLDPALPPNDLLFRLFHEDGVRVFAPSAIQANCRCSRERVSNVLRSLPRDEIEDLKVEGLIAVTCEFCNETYNFDDAQLAAVYD
jgi:molecular chaperone Hsp33